MKTNLVVGLGQIGSAIQAILGCDGVDIKPIKGKYDFLHICFPYSKTFIENVKKAQELYGGRVVIHSTIPVGTSDSLGATYSPCRGIHPHLEEGIRTFPKFFAGPDSQEVARIFKDKGLQVWITQEPSDLEAAKLWDTTQYGWNIVLEKMIFEYCERNNLNFDIVYTHFNSTYNDGYDKLGHPEYKKYILKHHKGKIGGHCVIPNLDLLDSEVSDYIREYNAGIREV